MNITVKNNIAVLQSDELLITDSQSAIDLVMSVQYKSKCNCLIVAKENICEDFFRLSTGIMGEVLQKIINYQMKLAIVGDFSIYTSKPLHDFIYESNKDKNILFVQSENEAVEVLKEIK